jgi:hypothetical protein
VLSAVARLYPATVFDANVRIAQTNKDIEIRDSLGRDLSKALTDLDSLYDKLEHKGERAVPMDKIDRLKNDRDEARTRYNEVCHVVALPHHGHILYCHRASAAMSVCCFQTAGKPPREAAHVENH